MLKPAMTPEQLAGLTGVVATPRVGVATDRLEVVEQDLARRQVPARLVERFFAPLRGLGPGLPAMVWLALVADAYNLTMLADAREDAR